MFGRRSPPLPRAFESLPLTPITLRHPEVRIAVHKRGRFDGARLPVVCLADYTRNMADFAAFGPMLDRFAGANWPVLLIDLQGRGRSSFRRSAADYSTQADADDVADIILALGIERAIFLGQGHGGRVVLAMATRHHAIQAGAILIDASPTVDALSMVRTRDNALQLLATRGEREFARVSTEIWKRVYPQFSEDELIAFAERTYVQGTRRTKALFDRALLAPLKDVQVGDEFEGQWPLFYALADRPMLLARTELTDQVSKSVFDRMQVVRPDAPHLTIAGHGSPALLDSAEAVEPLARFIVDTSNSAQLKSAVAG